MIVWHGAYYAGELDVGGRYDPVVDTWLPMSIADAPVAWDSQTTIWTGSEMIAWGGAIGGATYADGGVYDPLTDVWTSTSVVDAPASRRGHTAIWTGSEMIVWAGSGQDDDGITRLRNDGGRYLP